MEDNAELNIDNYSVHITGMSDRVMLIQTTTDLK